MYRDKLRNTKDLDYKPYHLIGAKVLKNSEVMERLIEEDQKIVRKFSRFYEEYELDLLFEVADIEEGIVELKDLAEKYEDVHIKLEKKLGSEEYQETYTEYAKYINGVTAWIKEARIEIKLKKSQKVKKDDEIRSEQTSIEVEKVRAEEKYRSEQTSKEMEKVRAEEKYFYKRITNELVEMNDDESTFVENHEKNLIAAQNLIHGYTKIFVEIESLGVEFLNEFGERFQTKSHDINVFIHGTRVIIQKLKTCALEREENLKKSEELAKLEQEGRQKVLFLYKSV